MKLINTIISFLIFTSLLFLFLKRGEEFLFFVVDAYSMSWMFANFLMHLFLLLNGLLIIGAFFRKTLFFKTILFVFVSFNLLIYLQEIFIQNHFQSHLKIGNIYLEILILSFLLLSIFLVKEKRSINLRLKKWWQRIIFGLVVTAFVFFKPVYLEDWQLSAKIIDGSEGKELYSLDHSLVDEEPFLVPLFTTSCPHCNQAAIKLGIQERNGKLPKTLIVFPSTKEDAENFLKRNQLENVDYLLVDDQTFLKYAGNRFPSIFYVDQNQYYHWVGGQFGYAALDFIIK